MISTEVSKQLHQRFNPEGSNLRRHQHIMFDMLKEFDLFCQQNGLTYWLSSGTLLGAVRHGGFIPWDDDLDIEMFKEDFKHLILLRQKLFDETGIMLQDHSTDLEYIAPYAKLRDLNSELYEVHRNDLHYKYRGIYIDIFVRDKSSMITSFLSHGCQFLAYKLTRVKNEKIRKPWKNMLWFTLHSFMFPFLNTIDKYLYHTNKYRHIKGSGYYDYVIEDEIFPLKKIGFENYIFPAPNKTDVYLKRLYGEYLNLPNLDDLHRHYGIIKFDIYENTKITN